MPTLSGSGCDRAAGEIGDQAVADLLHHGLVKGLQGGAGHSSPAHRTLGKHRGVRIVPVGIEQGFGVFIGGRQHLVTPGSGRAHPAAVRPGGDRPFRNRTRNSASGPGGSTTTPSRAGRESDDASTTASQPPPAWTKCFQSSVGSPVRSPKGDYDVVGAQIRGQGRFHVHTDVGNGLKIGNQRRQPGMRCLHDEQQGQGGCMLHGTPCSDRPEIPRSTEFKSMPL